MPSASLQPTQQSGARIPGTWRLEAGRAATLRPRHDGVLCIADGRAWVTFDGPHAGPANDLGDRILAPGERLHVPAGRRVVIESCDAGLPLGFDWCFARAAEPVPQATVRQSWRELREAAVLGLGAAWRLARALAALGAGALLPRPAPVALR